jgi:hypothetical protein
MPTSVLKEPWQAILGGVALLLAGALYWLCSSDWFTSHQPQGLIWCGVISAISLVFGVLLWLKPPALILSDSGLVVRRFGFPGAKAGWSEVAGVQLQRSPFGRPEVSILLSGRAPILLGAIYGVSAQEMMEMIESYRSSGSPNANAATRPSG